MNTNTNRTSMNYLAPQGFNKEQNKSEQIKEPLLQNSVKIDKETETRTPADSEIDGQKQHIPTGQLRNQIKQLSNSLFGEKKSLSGN